MSYIYQTINSSQFTDAFKSYGRGEQFSYHALKALYEYLEEIAADSNEPFELDVIALCCDFSEYENLEALQSDYPDIKNMDDLADHTTVIKIDDDSFLIQQF